MTRKSVFGCLLGALVLAGCGDGDGDRVVQGETMTIFGGEVSNWARLDKDGQVIEVGTSLSLDTVEGASRVGGDVAFKLDFPAEARDQTCCFDHLTLDYHPGGHGPPPYLLPHFDFHFYSYDQETEEAVTCDSQTMPMSERLPANYIIPSVEPEPDGTCVPGMGVHAIDMTSPELAPKNPSVFTETFILGYDQGELIFIEPMVTRDYLLQRQDFGRDVPRPESLGRSTLWPSVFDAIYDADADEYRFVFSNFATID